MCEGWLPPLQKETPRQNTGLIIESQRHTTGIIPGRLLPFSGGLFRAPLDRDIIAGTGESAVPSVGTVTIAVFPVEFDDVEFRTNVITPDSAALSNYLNFLFISNVHGTVHNYYWEMSGGLLDFRAIIFPKKKITGSKAFYGNDDALGWSNFIYQAGTELASRITAPQIQKLDINGDRYIDAVLFLTAGSGRETSGSSNDIPSHTSSFAGRKMIVTVGSDTTRRLGRYVIAAERLNTASAVSNITNYLTAGVIIHELGHVFGLPDLYRTDGVTTDLTVDSAELMAWGAYNFDRVMENGEPAFGSCPAPLSSYHRMLLGWITFARTINGSHISSAYLKNGETVHKLKGLRAEEYWLVENRNLSGYDFGLLSHRFWTNAQKVLNGKETYGLLLWKVNETQYAEYYSVNEVNNLIGNRGLDIISAAPDVVMSAGNTFSSRCFWTKDNITLNDFSVPAARYPDNGLSGITFSTESDPGDVMQFSFGAQVLSNSNTLSVWPNPFNPDIQNLSLKVYLHQSETKQPLKTLCIITKKGMVIKRFEENEINRVPEPKGSFFFVSWDGILDDQTMIVPGAYLINAETDDFLRIIGTLGVSRMK